VAKYQIVPSFWGPYTKVNFGLSPFTPNPLQRALLVDATPPGGGGEVEIILPTPYDGLIILITDEFALSSSNSILVTPTGVGVKVPDLLHPGAYIAGPTAIQNNLGVGLQFILADNQWIRWA
jgi:hypothetical protein